MTDERPSFDIEFLHTLNNSEQVYLLRRDLWYVGLSTGQTQIDGDSLYGNPVGLQRQRRDGIPILVYSEVAAQQALGKLPADWRSPKLCELASMLCIESTLSPLILVSDGTWPVPSIPTMGMDHIPSIALQNAGSIEVIQAIVGHYRTELEPILSGGTAEVAQRLREGLSITTNEHTYSVLLFGPAAPATASPRIARLFDLRMDVRRAIQETPNVLSVFGEDLIGAGLSLLEAGLNDLTKEKLVAAGPGRIVILAEAPGSLIELAAFAQHEGLARRLLVAMNAEYRQGFAAKGGLGEAANLGATAMFYEDHEVENGSLFRRIIDEVLGHYNAHIQRHVDR